jgi:predicted RNase H-like nuclease
LSNQLTIIGLDLAWSPRNPSGGAVICGDATGGRLVEPPATLLSNEAIVAFVERTAPEGPAVVAIDAPLLVPNANGRRPAEAALAQVFGAYHAGAHPANRRLLAREGVVRGEALVKELAQRGWSYSDHIAANEQRRVVVEVFPHPAMVAIFGLQRTLKYKAKPRRSRELQLAAWQAYQNHLQALANGDPPLQGLASLLAVDVATLRPRALKAYEDQVDAVMCAYIGLYANRWGTRRCAVFGSLAEGSIFTPVPFSEGVRTQCAHPLTPSPPQAAPSPSQETDQP